MRGVAWPCGHTACGVRIVFVTHLYDLAESCYRADTGQSLFRRAERDPGGERSLRLPRGEPLPTSYGEDLYREIFGRSLTAAGA